MPPAILLLRIGTGSLVLPIPVFLLWPFLFVAYLLVLPVLAALVRDGLVRVLETGEGHAGTQTTLRPRRRDHLRRRRLSRGQRRRGTVRNDAGGRVIERAQTLKAFIEAEAYDGPSLIIAYSHCIAHGIDMSKGMDQQKLAVHSGYWPLYRFDPRLSEEGKNPLQLDSRAPSVPIKQFAYNETRYRMLRLSDEARAGKLLAQAQDDVNARWELYRQLAAIDYGANGAGDTETDTDTEGEG